MTPWGLPFGALPRCTCPALCAHAANLVAFITLGNAGSSITDISQLQTLNVVASSDVVQPLLQVGGER